MVADSTGLFTFTCFAFQVVLVAGVAMVQNVDIEIAN